MKTIKINRNESVTLDTGDLTLSLSVDQTGDVTISTNNPKTHVSTHQQSGQVDVKFWRINEPR